MYLEISNTCACALFILACVYAWNEIDTDVLLNPRPPLYDVFHPVHIWFTTVDQEPEFKRCPGSSVAHRWWWGQWRSQEEATCPQTLPQPPKAAAASYAQDKNTLVPRLLCKICFCKYYFQGVIVLRYVCYIKLPTVHICSSVDYGIKSFNVSEPNWPWPSLGGLSKLIAFWNAQYTNFV